MNSYHTPVLTEEVLIGLQIKPGERYIDATLGGGGHASEIIKRGGILLGIDADSDAVEFGKRRMGLTNCTFVQGNFRAIKTIAETNGFTDVSGILMDLGVSSFQLDTAQRGFSYRFLDSDLDMRMDRSRGMSAAEYLNSVTEGELYEIFTKFGEEERSGAIAHALIRARQIKEFKTVSDLTSGIEKAIGNTLEKNSVFSRIFQSIRMQINDEIGALREGIDQAYDVLGKRGRLAVISFHSIEDRLVKLTLKKPIWKSISKKPITASPQEEWENRRSRSAKLRIVEKI